MEVVLKQKEIDCINMKLGRMVSDVAFYIEAMIPSLNILISYMRNIKPDLRPQLSRAKSFDDVVEIIRDDCSLTNISLLEDIVERYSVTDANQLIEDFNFSIEKFCDEQICNVKLKECSLLTCNTIKFIVNWEISECTLNSVKHLYQEAFQKLDKKVEVVEMRDKHSILITCYAPHHLMDMLYMEAQENIKILKKMGLIQLTIGYYTVYSKYEVSVLYN